MNHTGMLLWRANIAGVFESDPRVASFKQHGQHLAPQVSRWKGARGFDFTSRGFFFIGHIGPLKVLAKLVMQVRYVAW